MSAFFPIVVHHNPGCGTSRNVIAMIEEAGLKPVVIEYLQTGWTRPQLQGLFAASGARAREMVAWLAPSAACSSALVAAPAERRAVSRASSGLGMK